MVPHGTGWLSVDCDDHVSDLEGSLRVLRIGVANPSHPRASVRPKGNRKSNAAWYRSSFSGLGYGLQKEPPIGIIHQQPEISEDIVAERAVGAHCQRDISKHAAPRMVRAADEGYWSDLL